jgi:hypothetical protein
MKRFRLLRAVSVTVAVASAGCASGPAFVALEPPNSGGAAVYVYRVNSVPGAAIKHELWVGSRPAGMMVNGGYKRFEVRPGANMVSAPDCRPVTTIVAPPPGGVAYVQLELINKTVEFGGRYYFDFGCRLVPRTEAEALAALPGLRLATN